MKSPIAICIGHSRKIYGRPEGGAVMVTGENEWTFNRGIGAEVVKFLADMRIPSLLIDDYQGTGYTAAQRWLAEHLRSIGAKASIELHFNSADTKEANGHEWLYWHASSEGNRLAGELDSEMCMAVPEIRHRGILARTKAHRGAEFLRGTPCPAVIAEMFFGSNAHDCAVATLKKSKIARAISQGIAEWFD